ncbi:MAG: tetratricopeptide repeat protein [Vicingaceae bacterium]
MKKELSKCSSDSSFSDTYLLIARSFLNKDNDSVLFYIEKAKPYNINYLKGSASENNLIATVEFRKGNYEKSRFYFLEALKIADKQKDSLKIGAYSNNAGLTYTYQGNYENAISLLMESLTIRELIKDPKISSTYNNIGVAYEQLGQLKKAVKFQLLALKEKEKQGNQLKISNTLNNLGIIYRKRELYDSSFYYYDKALQAALKTDNLAQISNAYNNLGFLFFNQEKATEAEDYYLKAVSIKEKLGKTFELRNSYSNLCKLYLKKGENIKAKKYFYLAEAQKDSSDSKAISLSQQQLKVKLETALGNYQSALESSNKAFLLYQELVNEKNVKNIEELNTKYETEKKEQEIKVLNLKNTLQQAEIEQNKLIKLGFIVGSILLLLIIIIIYSLYNLKRKTNTLLTLKNEELQEVNAIKDQLFSVVSHDLKNPVFAFKNLTNNLTKGFNKLPQETIQNLIIQLNNTSNSLYDSLNNILSWSLSQQNKITIENSSVNIKKLIDEVILLHKMNIDEKKIEITNNINQNLVIKTDKNILSTVFRNILMNAIKFSPISGKIIIDNTKTGITITDSGIGMLESDVAKLFDIKNDVKQIGGSTEKGTGLGLLLCKELLEKISSKIEITSQLNKGTSVSVILS